MRALGLKSKIYDRWAKSNASFFKSVLQNDMKMVQSLLDADINVNMIATDATALTLAVREGHMDMIRLLIEHKADVNVIYEQNFFFLIVRKQALKAPILRCTKLLKSTIPLGTPRYFLILFNCSSIQVA